MRQEIYALRARFNWRGGYSHASQSTSSLKDLRVDFSLLDMLCIMFEALFYRKQVHEHFSYRILKLFLFHICMCDVSNFKIGPAFERYEAVNIQTHIAISYLPLQFIYVYNVQLLLAVNFDCISVIAIKAIMLVPTGKIFISSVYRFM